MVITEMGVFEQRDGEMILTEIDEDVSLDAVRAATGFSVKVADDLSPMKQQWETENETEGDIPIQSYPPQRTLNTAI